MDAMEVVKLLLYPALSVAGAWGGVKAVLNGTVERVQRIEKKLDRVSEDMTSLRERVAKVER